MLDTDFSLSLDAESTHSLLEDSEESCNEETCSLCPVPSVKQKGHKLPYFFSLLSLWALNLTGSVKHLSMDRMQIPEPHLPPAE